MSLLEFWFPNDEYQLWWFKSTNELDYNIYKKYYKLMLDTYNNFDINKYNELSSNIIIQDIILLDQISRNINRIVKNLDIEKYTNYANELSNIWITRKYHLICPIKFTVFALLPIRHSKDIIKIKELLLILNEIEQKNTKIIENKIYQKFKFFTIRQFNLQEQQHL